MITDSSPDPTERGASWRLALSVLETLREAGHEAYFVGGCVRDRLLGIVAEDVDIASSASPAEVSRLFSKVILVGARFGVCRVRARGIEVEVAAFRTDRGIADGRRPLSVGPATAREDVLRRDFTINGMLYDPATDEVIDYVGGRRDLAAKVVRAIGFPHERFREDRLRMLRAVRFAARFDFAIDPATEAAIAAHAAHVLDVSDERIRDELLLILQGPDPVRGFTLLEELGLLPVILPELTSGCGPNAEDSSGGTKRLLAAFAAMRERDERIVLAGLLRDLAPAAVGEVVTRLKLPRRVSRDVVNAVQAMGRLWDRPDWAPSDLKRLLREPHGKLLVPLSHLLCEAERSPPPPGVLALRDAAERFDERDLNPGALFSGRELMDLGYPRGPLLGEIIAALETAQLDGLINDREGALRFLRAHFPL